LKFANFVYFCIARGKVTITFEVYDDPVIQKDRKFTELTKLCSPRIE
jgi:hypothetical protein